MAGEGGVFLHTWVKTMWSSLGTEGWSKSVQEVELIGPSEGVDDRGQGEGCVKDDYQISGLRNW